MRVVMACVLSFVLALVVGIFVLPGTGPAHKSNQKPRTEPVKPQAQAAPTLEMLPALPAFPAARPAARMDVPASQNKDAGPLLKARRYEEAEKASLSAAHEVRAEQPVSAGVSKRNGTIPNTPSPTAQIVTVVQPAAKPSSVDPRRRVSQTKGAQQPTRSSAGAFHTPAASATVPPAGASRTPTVRVTVPPAAASRTPTVSRNVPPVVAPAQGRQVVVTQPTPNSAQAQTPDVTRANPPESAAPDVYLLGPGDQIEVNVPHLAVMVTIGHDGVIALPLVGPVQAAGKTTAQLAGDLTTMYAKVLTAPSVTVFVRQSRLSR